MLHDHRVDEGVQLVEIGHHCLVFRSDLFLTIGAEGRRGETSGLVWRRGECSHGRVKDTGLFQKLCFALHVEFLGCVYL